MTEAVSRPPNVGLIMEPFQEGVEDWSTYVERLDMYFDATNTPPDKKVSTMITLLPPRIYALLKDIVSPEKPKDKKFDELVAALQKQLDPPPLTIAERFRFHRRHQHEGESINTFCAELKKLARYCDFGENLTDSLRDRFVCGLNNDAIQKRLLAEEKLTLDKAISVATAMETASKDTAELQGKSSVISGVNKLYIPKSTTKGNITREANLRSTLPVKESTSTKLRGRCFRCTSKLHYANDCPHKNKTCRKCKLKGHVEAFCRSKNKRTNNVNQIEDTTPVYTLSNSKDKIQLNVKIDGKTVKMQLDTG